MKGKNRFRRLGEMINKAAAQLGCRIVTIRSYQRLDLYPERARPLRPRYVNIGAGAFRHPYWHNLDMPNRFYSKAQSNQIHIVHDLTSGDPLPLADGSLKAVYMSHVVEHLPDASVRHCFAEVYRALQPGGFFRLSCPDIDLEYDAYCRQDLDFWIRPSPWGTNAASVEQQFLEHFATVLTLEHPDETCHKYTDNEIREVFAGLTKEEALNFLVDLIPSETRQAYPENHVNWFNVDKLCGFLHTAGFDEVYESRYGQSKFAPMRALPLFDSTMPGVSLYVECQKRG